jgi:hypothetical protein
MLFSVRARLDRDMQHAQFLRVSLVTDNSVPENKVNVSFLLFFCVCFFFSSSLLASPRGYLLLLFVQNLVMVGAGGHMVASGFASEVTLECMQQNHTHNANDSTIHAAISREKINSHLSPHELLSKVKSNFVGAVGEPPMQLVFHTKYRLFCLTLSSLNSPCWCRFVSCWCRFAH